jgi:hypothetical protein
VDDQLEGWEPADEVLAFADAAGYPSNRYMLKRWHQARVIGRPRVRHLEGSRGTETLYPPGTSDRFVAGRRIHEQEKLLDRVAWRLWWDGFPVEMNTVRSFLIERGRWWDERVAGLTDENGELSEEVQEFLAESEVAHLDEPVLRQIRRRLGKEKFADFLELLLRSVVLGEGIAEKRSLDLVDRGLAFNEGRKPSPFTGQPWIVGPLDEDLAAIHRIIAGRSFVDAITEASDGDLQQACDDARSIVVALVSLGDMVQSIFGRWAMGFSFFGRAMRPVLTDAKAQAFFVTLMLRCRQDPFLSENVPVVRQAAENWENRGFRAWTTMQRLAEAVPAIADLVDVRRLKRAFKNPIEQEKLDAEIRELREDEDNAAEIDAFFATHPEVLSGEVEGNAAAP